jgi:hypothetical protein
MPVNEKAEAQTVLDQLWNEHLIPFPLSVGKITADADEQTIHFHDSRMRTAHIPRSDGQPFIGRLRSAVLERVARMSGPLAKAATVKISS